VVAAFTDFGMSDENPNKLDHAQNQVANIVFFCKKSCSKEEVDWILKQKNKLQLEPETLNRM